MPEPESEARSPRGRLGVIVILLLATLGLGYAIVGIATQEPGKAEIEVAGISDAQRLFGGMPQEGERLGSSNAPVTIQVFNDLQCSPCRDDFLTTIPVLAEQYARTGEAKLLYRHYSAAESPMELGFFGAEAAAEQNYGWQYTYLFFRNQDEAEVFGIDQEFLDAIAVGIEKLDFEEWSSYLELEGGTDGAIAARLEGYEELGAGLGIRPGQAAIVTGPGGTVTLQEGPRLAAIERAIDRVR